MNEKCCDKNGKYVKCSPDPGGSISKKSGFLINISQ